MLIKHRIIGAFLCAAIISGQVIPLNADGNVIVIDGLDEVNAQRKKDAESTKQTAMIGANDVPLYGSADNQSTCLGYLQMGCDVQLVQLAPSYSTVEIDGITGYIDTSKLITDTDAQKAMIQSLNLRSVVIATVGNMPIRESADILGSIISRTQAGTDYNYVSTVGEYYQVEMPSGLVGYVKSEYTNLTYDYPTMTSSPKAQSCDLVAEDVIIKTKKIGEEAAQHSVVQQAPQYYYNYNSYQFNNAGQANVPNIPINGTGQTTDLRRSIVQFAVQYVGNKYVWGGEDLDNGIDCSGFVMKVYEHFGYSLNRVAEDQANNGFRISPYNVQPGDLIFFAYEDGYIHHVGMYIGGNQYVHSSNSADYPAGGVKISNYDPSTVYCAVDIVDN